MLWMKKLTLQNEREERPRQKTKTRLRERRKRRVDHTGLKAKRAVLQKRMSSTASTNQRKKQSLAAAVGAEKRKGPKAETRPTSIKVATGEGVQEAKKETKKRRQEWNRVKIEVKIENLIQTTRRGKGRKKREQGQNP